MKHFPLRVPFSDPGADLLGLGAMVQHGWTGSQAKGQTSACFVIVASLHQRGGLVTPSIKGYLVT